MKTSNRVLLAALLCTVIITAIISCQKGTSSYNSSPAGKQSVQVYMNDDPVPDLYKVLVDIRYIEVKVDTGATHHDDDYYNNDHDGDNDHHDHDQFGKWDTLSITPRVYDLLKLKNGVDTLVANNYAHTGKITRMRITLGPNNVVWTDSTHSYPLPICDNRPYIYIRVMSNTIETLANNQIRIRVDFDVAKSVEFENGTYCFEPKMRCYQDNTTGKIEGIVKPRDAHALIKVFNNTDTAYAIPEEGGEFRIRGLKPSTYSVLYKARIPYKDSLVNNIQVQAGQETNLPSVTLHQ
jgi:hypothetical protein